MGVARALVGSFPFHSSSPVSTSNALRCGSSVPPRKTSPPPVTIGPPSAGEPSFSPTSSGNQGSAPIITSHFFSPVDASMAASAPNGGALHGMRLGENSQRSEEHTSELQSLRHLV